MGLALAGPRRAAGGATASAHGKAGRRGTGGGTGMPTVLPEGRFQQRRVEYDGTRRERLQCATTGGSGHSARQHRERPTRVEAVVWSLLRPQDDLGILYAVGWRPAAAGTASPPQLSERWGHARCCSSSSAGAAPAKAKSQQPAASPGSRRASRSGSAGQRRRRAHRGVSASVHSGNLVWGGKSHSVHSKQGVTPGISTLCQPGTQEHHAVPHRMRARHSRVRRRPTQARLHVAGTQSRVPWLPFCCLPQAGTRAGTQPAASATCPAPAACRPRSSPGPRLPIPRPCASAPGVPLEALGAAIHHGLDRGQVWLPLLVILCSRARGSRQAGWQAGETRAVGWAASPASCLRTATPPRHRHHTQPPHHPPAIATRRVSSHLRHTHTHRNHATCLKAVYKSQEGKVKKVKNESPGSPRKEQATEFM